MEVRLVLILALVVAVLCSLPVFQKDALVGLFNATSGASWYVGWDTSVDPCTGAWKGVVCSSTNNTVLELDLRSNNLNGTLVDLALPSLMTL